MADEEKNITSDAPSTQEAGGGDSPDGGVLIGNASEKSEFELSDDAQKALGVNADLTERDESEDAGTSKKTTDGDSEKDTKNKKDTGGDTSEKTTDGDGNKEKPDDEDATSEKTTGDDEDGGGTGDFQSAVLEKLGAFDSEDKQQQFLKDMENYESFMAGNTNMRKALARIGGKEAIAAIEALEKVDDLDEVMESLDEWYDGEDKNPFRALVGSLKDVAPKVQEQHEEAEQMSEKELELALEKEIIAIQRMDSTVGDGTEEGNKKLQKLGEMADAEGVTLMAAYKMQRSDDLQKSVETLKADLAKARKELKERNAELKKARETAPPGPGAMGDGVESYDVVDSGDTVTFDSIQAKVNKKLGVD